MQWIQEQINKGTYITLGFQSIQILIFFPTNVATPIHFTSLLHSAS